MSVLLPFCEGERVRLIEETPSTQIGDEATIIKIVCDEQGNCTALTILVDSDPARTHGTTVPPHQVEKVGRADAA